MRDGESLEVQDPWVLRREALTYSKVGPQAHPVWTAQMPYPCASGQPGPKSSIAGPRAKGPSKSSGSQDPRPPQEHRPHPKPGSKQQLHARDPREHPPPGWSSYIRNRPFPSTALDSDRTSGPRVSLSLITELHSAWGRMTAMWARGHLPPSDLWPLGQVGPSLELWPSWS